MFCFPKEWKGAQHYERKNIESCLLKKVLLLYWLNLNVDSFLYFLTTEYLKGPGKTCPVISLAFTALHIIEMKLIALNKTALDRSELH